MRRVRTGVFFFLATENGPSKQTGLTNGERKVEDPTPAPKPLIKKEKTPERSFSHSTTNGGKPVASQDASRKRQADEPIEKAQVTPTKKQRTEKPLVTPKSTRKDPSPSPKSSPKKHNLPPMLSPLPEQKMKKEELPPMLSPLPGQQNPALPPMLSPLPKAKYGLPPMLSPTLPAQLEAALRKIDDKDSRRSSDVEENPIKGSGTGKVDMAVQSTTAKGRTGRAEARSPKPEKMHSSMEQPTTSEATRSLIVKLKYGKRWKKDVQRILRFPSRGKKAEVGLAAGFSPQPSKPVRPSSSSKAPSIIETNAVGGSRPVKETK